MEYQALANFILEIMALPQSTAGVERTFSKVNNYKIRLRSSLSVSTVESIVKVNELFKGNFEINDRLAHLHGNARKFILKNTKKLTLMTLMKTKISCKEKLLIHEITMLHVQMFIYIPICSTYCNCLIRNSFYRILK